jgi:GT2 family glycosyltransferase
MTEDLSILIGCLGHPEQLRSCLQSIFETVTSETSIHVTVGFNFEGESQSPEAIAREFPSVAQLRAPAKLGYCRAYNQLMAQGVGRYALLLDDDTLMRPGTIDGMVRFMDSHPDVGIAGCRTVNPDGTYQKTTASMFTMRTELANAFLPSAFWRDGVDESVTGWQSVGWLNGHFLVVRAQVIQQVGMLDEFFFTFQCEADWCLRIQRAGWKVAYVPEFEVMHVGGQHSVATSVKSYKSLLRSHINRYYFIRKHYGAAAFHAFRLIMSVGAALRLLTYSVVWLLNPRRRPEARLKIEAYRKIVLMGAVAHPEKLPDDLRVESTGFSLVPLRNHEAKPAGVTIQ